MVPIARRILLHDPVRLGITLAGITFSVVLVLVQCGIYLRIMTNSSQLIDSSDADIWVTCKDCRNFDFSLPIPESKVDLVRGCGLVSHAEGLIMTWGIVKLPTGGSDQLQIIGLHHESGPGPLTDMISGERADLATHRGVILDESSRRRIGWFDVGDYIEVSGKRVRVVGVCRGVKSLTTSPMAFCAYGTAREISAYAMPGLTSFVQVWLRPGASPEVALAELRRIPGVEVLPRVEFSHRTRWYWTFSTGMGLGFLLVTIMGFGIGMVIVGQTIYSSTLEHIREFGTLKAIGAENRLVYGVILKQAVTASVIGYALGLAGALLLSHYYGKWTGVDVVLAPALSAGIFALTVVMCMAASLISIRKVAVLDPMTVFRTG